MPKLGHSQSINPNQGQIMTSNTTPHSDDLSDQIEHAIESVLDMANPPHELDSKTGEPFEPELTPDGGVPVVTDAELEQQALVHPGADGDASTPE